MQKVSNTNIERQGAYAAMKNEELRVRLFQVSHEFRKLRIQRMFPDVSRQEFMAMEIIHREEEEKNSGGITVSGLAKIMRFFFAYGIQAASLCGGQRPDCQK